MQIDQKTLMAIIPLVIIQLALLVICLADWLKRKKFKYLDKWIWLIIFLFFNILGPIFYLTIGRDHDDHSM